MLTPLDPPPAILAIPAPGAAFLSIVSRVTPTSAEHGALESVANK